MTSQKTYTHGMQRTMSPQATLARAKPFLTSMGITRIANVTGLDRIGIPVVTVMRPNSRSISVSQGKGASLAAAKASGVMEAIESFHAERIEQPLMLGSHGELAGRWQLADTTGLARLRDGAYHDELPMLWIKGRDLLNERSAWLPYECVHTRYTLPMPTGSGCFVASTNGLASGNHLTEATAHAISEVIERDANTLWNRLSDGEKAARRIDLTTIDDDLCQQVIAKLYAADMSVTVWNMTSDTQVPAFYCLIADERFSLAHSGEGAGCHPDRRIALLRALTEAVQVRTNYITGARDDLAAAEYRQEGIAAKLAYVEAMTAPAGPAPMNFTDVETTGFSTFDQDVGWMLERLAHVGVNQVIAVDLTREAFAIPVVRVVIPGLEGPDDHDDYTPGARAVGQEA